MIIPKGGRDNDLAGTIHSHPPDPGAQTDVDHKNQTAFMRGEPSSTAFSYNRKDADIDQNILDQQRADKSNPLPFQQEHYLITAQKHIWMYRPEWPIVGSYSAQPEQALKKSRFSYVGQLKD